MQRDDADAATLPRAPDVEPNPDAGPTEAQASVIVTLARRQVALIKEIDAAETELKGLQAQLKTVTEVDLPNAMTAAGVKKFELSNGWAVESAQAVHASIPKSNPEPAHEWLDANGHGSLIKRRIEIFFGRDQIKWAQKFIRDCARRKQPLDLRQKQWVEPQTLLAFVREQRRDAIAEGRDPDAAVPKDLLGVYVQEYAKVTAPKEPK